MATSSATEEVVLVNEAIHRETAPPTDGQNPGGNFRQRAFRTEHSLAGSDDNEPISRFNLGCSSREAGLVWNSFRYSKALND